MIDGSPVIDSIGDDGVDDRGLVDSNQGLLAAGDMIYRLPRRK